MTGSHIMKLVGSTPVLRLAADASGPSLYLKLEGNNPTGSVKDRACVAMLRDKIERQELGEDVTLLDASSGNMACSIAYFGRVLGRSVTVVTNSKLTDEKRAFVEYFGAHLIQLGEFTIEGNRYCHDLVQRDMDGRYCFLDQLHNPHNPRAHERTTGPEILADVPDVGMIVASLGSGGCLLGTATFLRSVRRSIRVVAVEAASGAKIPGTGAFDDGDYITPFIRQSREDGLIDHTIKVDARDAYATLEEFKDVGVFGGLQTGSVIHAARQAASEMKVKGSVVAIAGDSGWKNLATLMAGPPAVKL